MKPWKEEAKERTMNEKQMEAEKKECSDLYMKGENEYASIERKTIQAESV